jgi:hypothetical protein
MLADHMSKPLQGEKFKNFADQVMGLAKERNEAIT